jgi:hypothetical protein
LQDWVATVIGLAGGFAVAYSVAQAALPRLIERSRNPTRLIKLAFGGTVIALLPALLLSIVVGATLGNIWGTAGMVAGVAVVFSVLLLAGTFAGILLAGYFK